VDLVTRIVIAVLLLGPVLALTGPFLAVLPRRLRRIVPALVAGDLLLAAAFAAWSLGPQPDSAGGVAYVVAAVGLPLLVGGLIATAVRRDRLREVPRWSPAAVLSAFPAFVVTGAIILLAAATDASAAA